MPSHQDPVTLNIASLARSYWVVLWQRDYFGVCIVANYLILCTQGGEEGADEAILRAKEKYEYDFKRSSEGLSAKSCTLSNVDRFGCLIAVGSKYPADLSNENPKATVPT